MQTRGVLIVDIQSLYNIIKQPNLQNLRLRTHNKISHFNTIQYILKCTSILFRRRSETVS